MEKIAVFVNDAEYARHILEPMLNAQQPTHWVVVACAPTFTRHIGRWVSQSAREQWRSRWAGEVCAEVESALKSQAGNTVERVVPKRSLIDTTSRLQARLGQLRLLDARRPRLGKPDQPLTATQPSAADAGWVQPVAVATGLSAMLALVD